MAPTRVILMSCGSYNPPTNMHLRMFEIARDHLHRMGTHIVVGGVISPVHDAYAKKELAGATHRCTMLKLALHNNDWIRISTWEVRQDDWTKTRLSLQHHQNLLNSILFDTNGIKHHLEIEDLDWIPENVKNDLDRTPIQIKLLCGADLLESFGTPGLWADEDIDAIVGQHGLVVITREGSNPNKFIYDSDILSKYMYNILIVTEWIPNEVSSTKIRRALKRGESVKYLVQDPVIDYIYKHGIYDTKTTAGTTTIKLKLSSNNANNYLNVNSKYQNAFLTPSPSDVTMESPSPVEIISIDVPNSVLKKNLQNSSTYSTSKLGSLGDTEQLREKFISVISENGNKLLTTLKTAYPGQAKQIIATETGESQILDEVGLCDDGKKAFGVEISSEEYLSQENERCLGSKYRVDDESCEVPSDLYSDGDDGRKLSAIGKVNFNESKTDTDQKNCKKLELDCRSNDFDSDDESLRVTSYNVNEVIESLITEDNCRFDFSQVLPEVNVSKTEDNRDCAYYKISCKSAVETERVTEKTNNLYEAKNNFNDKVVRNVRDKSSDRRDDRNTDIIDLDNSRDSLLEKNDGHCRDNYLYDHARKSFTFKHTKCESFNSSTRENNETYIADVERQVEVEKIKNDVITMNSICNNDNLNRTNSYPIGKNVESRTRDKFEEKVDGVDKNSILIERDRDVEANREEQIMEQQESRNTNIELFNVDTKFLIEKRAVKCVSNVDKLEIDGKYLKSLVNSRKSPKKLKGKSGVQVRVNVDDNCTTIDKHDVPEDICLEDHDGLSRKKIIEPKKNDTPNFELQTELASNLEPLIFEGISVADSVSKVERKLPRNPEVTRDSGKSENEELTIDDPKKKKKKKKKKQQQLYDPLSRGSLDSIDTTEPRTLEKSEAFESITKKSKSYESVKCGTRKSYQTFDSSKSKNDSTLRLIGANNFDERTNDFCTECCYANDPSITGVDLNRQIFCTLRSSDTSPVNEGSPECDICCNACQLQSSVDMLDYKTLPATGGTSCELCEICADDDTDFTTLSGRELTDVANERERLSRNPSKDTLIGRIDGKDDSFEIKDCDVTTKGRDTAKIYEDLTLDCEESIDERDRRDLDSDQFEIENCGLDVEHLRSSILCRSEDEKLNCQFVPKDEIGMMSTKSAIKRNVRRGSSVKRNVAQRSQDKRRYSSVDSLQYTKTFFKSGDKFVGTKGSKLIASADNIRSENSRSGKSRKLQRSADDVGRIDSLADNLDSLDDDKVENAYSRPDQWKVRDNDMVKMILTKHGIKIISEKETAL